MVKIDRRTSMYITENRQYQEEIQTQASIPLPWERLKDRSILISGATGMIGSYLIDLLMYKNKSHGLNCRVYAISRREENARARFAPYWDREDFQYFSRDINQTLTLPSLQADYVIHGASNTHPVAYATDPIGTILTNITGTAHLLDLASLIGCRRFVFLSSVEIYGENNTPGLRFREGDCGYIDCNTMRAGYPESKRAGESLCQAYIHQKNMDAVIPRLSRVYGPTMLSSDSKALAQFLKKGAAREDIVLKSKGDQYYSYIYVGDAVSAILWTMLLGENGQAYNIADPTSDITLKDLAALIAGYAGTKVIYEIPDSVENAGYSKATRAVLDGTRSRDLGWRPAHTIQSGIKRTLSMLHSQLL